MLSTTWCYYIILYAYLHSSGLKPYKHFTYLHIFVNFIKDTVRLYSALGKMLLVLFFPTKSLCITYIILYTCICLFFVFGTETVVKKWAISLKTSEHTTSRTNSPLEKKEVLKSY